MRVIVLLDTTLSIIGQTERTHRNLGLYLVFAKLSDLADLGLFLVAPRGKGKTRIVEAITEIPHRDVLIITSLTPAGLPKLADELNNNRVTLLNKDVSTFYTDYLRDVGLNLIASLLTDHEYHSSTGRYYIDIKNAHVSFISAAQPKMIHKITKIDAWDSMYRDRYIRLYMLYYRPANYVEQKIKLEVEVPEDPIDQVTIPGNILESRDYKLVQAILQEQTSEGRGKLYINRLLKASAHLNGRDIVVEDDVKFLKLFILNIGLEKLLSERLYGVGESLIFNHNAAELLFYIYEHGEVSRRQMLDDFKVSSKTLQKDLKFLMAENLIAGTYGRPIYRPHPIIQENFIDPVVRFMEEMGIW